MVVYDELWGVRLQEVHWVVVRSTLWVRDSIEVRQGMVVTSLHH